VRGILALAIIEDPLTRPSPTRGEGQIPPPREEQTGPLPRENGQKIPFPRTILPRITKIYPGAGLRRSAGGGGGAPGSDQRG
jgi:hypothetical protein